jgi:hypothetical protein
MVQGCGVQGQVRRQRQEQELRVHGVWRQGELRVHGVWHQEQEQEPLGQVLQRLVRLVRLVQVGTLCACEASPLLQPLLTCSASSVPISKEQSKPMLWALAPT